MYIKQSEIKIGMDSQKAQFNIGKATKKQNLHTISCCYYKDVIRTKSNVIFTSKLSNQ